jgi:hypothetical protein
VVSIVPYPTPALNTSLTLIDDAGMDVPDQQALMDVFMAGLAKESDSEHAGK